MIKKIIIINERKRNIVKKLGKIMNREQNIYTYVSYMR